MSTRSATIIRQTTYWGEQAETEELKLKVAALWELRGHLESAIMDLEKKEQ